MSFFLPFLPPTGDRSQQITTRDLAPIIEDVSKISADLGMKTSENKRILAILGRKIEAVEARIAYFGSGRDHQNRSSYSDHLVATHDRELRQLMEITQVLAQKLEALDREQIFILKAPWLEIFLFLFHFSREKRWIFWSVETLRKKLLQLSIIHLGSKNSSSS